MAIALAIWAKNSLTPDDPRVPQKGDILAVRAGGWDFGKKVALPDFIIVTVEGMTVKANLFHQNPWCRKLKMTPTLINAAQDRWSILLEGVDSARNGCGGIKFAEIQGMLALWYSPPLTSTANSVTFEMTVLNAVKTRGFFNIDLTGAVFRGISFDQDTGLHTVKISTSKMAMSTGKIPAQELAHILINRGMDITSMSRNTLTFTAHRSDVWAEMLRDINDQFAVNVGYKRYCLKSSAVDSVISAGGTGTFTKAQFLRNRIDKADG